MLDRKLSIKHTVRLYVAVVVIGYAIIMGVDIMSSSILPLLQ